MQQIYTPLLQVVVRAYTEALGTQSKYLLMPSLRRPDRYVLQAQATNPMLLQLVVHIQHHLLSVAITAGLPCLRVMFWPRHAMLRCAE